MDDFERRRELRRQKREEMRQEAERVTYQRNDDDEEEAARERRRRARQERQRGQKDDGEGHEVNSQNSITVDETRSTSITNADISADDEAALLDRLAKREERRQKRLKEALDRQKEFDPTITTNESLSISKSSRNGEEEVQVNDTAPKENDSEAHRKHHEVEETETVDKSFEKNDRKEEEVEFVDTDQAEVGQDVQDEAPEESLIEENQVEVTFQIKNAAVSKFEIGGEVQIEAVVTRQDNEKEQEDREAEERERKEEAKREVVERERAESEKRAAEERDRLVEEAKHEEAERKAAEERERLEAERKAAVERERLEAERKAAEEIEGLEAEKKAAEERERMEAEQREKAEAEERERQEEERRAAEEKAAAERRAQEQLKAEQKRAEEERKRLQAEEKRKADEKKAAEEWEKKKAEDKKSAEEKARLESLKKKEDKLKAEEKKDKKAEDKQVKEKKVEEKIQPAFLRKQGEDKENIFEAKKDKDERGRAGFKKQEVKDEKTIKDKGTKEELKASWERKKGFPETKAQNGESLHEVTPQKLKHIDKFGGMKGHPSTDETDSGSKVEAGKRLEDLRRRKGDTETGEFEKLKQKQQEASQELEELKKRREERKKIMEEEEQRKKQEEAERKAKEEEEKKRLKEEIERRRAEAAEKRQKLPDDGLPEDKKPFKCFTPKGSYPKIEERAEFLNKSAQKSVKSPQPAVVSKIDSRLEQYTSAIGNNKGPKTGKAAPSDLPLPADGVRNIKSMWEKGNVFSSPGGVVSPNKETAGLKVGVSSRINEWLTKTPETNKSPSSKPSDLRPGDVSGKRNIWEKPQTEKLGSPTKMAIGGKKSDANGLRFEKEP
ncbi:caldesmon isoform X2 [Mixophyes fleayi]|uniref:caldesmon isoform X2 n=1 Tax=Mixophyes fleayi TaxID=3061075 RepID=UPI003F4E1CDF